MTARVRPPQLADAEPLARVHVAAWRAAYDGLMPADYLAGLDRDLDRRVDRWRRTVSAPVDGEACLVAADLESGEVLGFVVVGRPRDDVPAGTGELKAINLAPTAWGTGVGSQLFTAGVEWLAQRYDHAYLWVVDGNARARRFYDKHGWHADGGTKTDARWGLVLNELRYSRTLRPDP